MVLPSLSGAIAGEYGELDLQRGRVYISVLKELARKPIRSIEYTHFGLLRHCAVAR